MPMYLPSFERVQCHQVKPFCPPLEGVKGEDSTCQNETKLFFEVINFVDK
ncbi:hypothetical protein HNQ88_005030 [Aureibacter tunicatorum]|uniref:Uncharacterized protein n=1 Tax=Aureibacter tunicatorum TaxID=866807 RepID=A0AAE3XTT6_9BACT|nr:hypothetical protein [Aureibacter tunicatorum]BDD07549.1 hypothetical protein AUTU_50320 [Aureibacter tunicatorum]